MWGLAALAATFVVTRAWTVWAALHPVEYPGNGVSPVVTGDVELYARVAGALARGGLPYAGVAFEYPPGVLPYLTLAWWLPLGFAAGFALVLLLADVLTTAVLVRLGDGRRGGAWLWTLLVALLGPIVYARLDLLPATATVLAVYAAVTDRWGGAGAVVGYGAGLKLYPAALLPATTVVSKRPWTTAGLGVLFAVVPLLPYLPWWRALGDNVLGYHLGRGLQIESLWASLALAAERFGVGEVAVTFSHGAWHVATDAAGVLRLLAVGLSLAVVAAGTLAASRRRGDAAALTAASYAIVAGLVAVGTVLSPQFVLWVGALAAAAVAVGRAPAGTWGILAIAALTHLIYPWIYHPLLGERPTAVALLVVRNLLLVALAASALVSVVRRPRVE